MISVSKVGTWGVLSFLLLNLLGRFLFPFGDEPDFMVRAPKVLDGDHSWWSPFSVFSNFFASLNVHSNCKIESSPFSLVAHIDTITCSESIEQVFTRWFLVLLITFPLLVSALFRIDIFQSKKNELENHKKQEALTLSILFPGTIYYLGVLSEEQFTLVLSLLIFIFFNKRVVVLGIVAWVMAIDLGNSIVVLLFVLLAWLYLFIQKKYGIRLVLLVLIIQLLFCYSIGFRILEYVGMFGLITAKAESMEDLLAAGWLVEKYPVILRPIITYMTFIFSTATLIKVPLVYVIYGVSILLLIYKLYKRKKFISDVDSKHVVCALVGVATILSFVFLFPNYNNAKYYIFLLPFFMRVFLLISYYINMFSFIFVSNLIVYIHLLVYRVMT